MKRRTFLKTSGAACTSAALPNLLTSKTRKAIVLGKGDHQYTVEHGWGKLPEGHVYGNASHGVAIDKAGLIYITHQGKPGSIFLFDPDGKFIKAFGEIHVGRGHGIDIREESDGKEYIYLSPSNSALSFTKMTLEGEVLWQKGKKLLGELSGKYPDRSRYRPTNASFAPDGGYFLGDGYGGGYIHQFDSKDRYLRTIGSGGSADGQFRTPHGQWLDARDGTPKLAVCDRANKRLQWFDMDGRHLKTLGGFLFPADIDVQGDIMLVPDLHARITLLDENNKVLAHLGDNEEWRQKALSRGMRGKAAEWHDGRFVHPHDACFDKDGNIFCVEWVAGGRVTKLTRV
jgi:hypothetical protein